MPNHTVTLSVKGMHCSSCVKRVERALQAVQDVKTVRVDLARELAVVETTADQPIDTLLVDAVNNLGFRASALAAN